MPIRRWQKKEDGIYYREIDREAFLYLNFRKHPKPTEQEIEAQFLQARKERAEFVRRTGKMAQSPFRRMLYFFRIWRKNKDFQMHSNMICQVVFWNVWSGMRIS